jgi:hypothetical protein
VPGTLLTAVTLIIGIAAAPLAGMHGQLPFFALQYWLRFAIVFGGAVGFGAVLIMAFRRVDAPVRAIREAFDGECLASLAIGGFLIALSFTAFGFIKPELAAVGFSADPQLARVDRAILGTDAWRVFAWARHPYIGELYHMLWLGWLFLVLVFLLWQRPSVQKSIALIAYFLLWSIGPLVHLVVPGAGPVLYEAIGKSTDFAGLAVAPADAEKFNYLLHGYTTMTFNVAGGISAMPSLHIATMAWTILAFWQRSTLRSIGVAITLYMWLASVALGWHYFVDGAAGCLVAALSYLLARSWLRGRFARGFGKAIEDRVILI